MNKYLLSTILAFAVSLPSCDYLDYSESSGYGKEDMFVYFDRAKGMLTTAYSYLPVDFGSFDGATRAAATDEAEYAWSTSNIIRYNNGSWSPILTIDDVWGNYYAAIRTTNMFLENHQKDFENIEWNDDYALLMKQYQYYPYEARFLRAFYYFELAKRYKNVPLITDCLELEDANKVAPADFEKVIGFIVSECNEIADKLPVSYKDMPGAETGRITQGAVMALKSRVLLYAASPLYAGAVSQEKWVEAAKAAKQLIDKSESEGWYQLLDESSWNNLSSKELILETRQGNSNNFEKLNFPIGYEGGNSGTCPSQNLVDAFEMSDGSRFDWKNPEHVSNIYNPEKRDSRLFKTVLYNGSTFKNATVETFIGGKNGTPIDGATPTGYYLKKYVLESISLDPNNTTTGRHVWVLFRYAEVLLNYAEALYEAYGNPDYTDNTFTLSPRAAIDQVRTRAGMPGVATDNFRERIRNERQVELAFEDHRFWDVRRWKIADQTMDIYGVKIEKKGNDLIYTRQLVDQRTWNDRMYLYPISNAELFKNTLLNQNPDW